MSIKEIEQDLRSSFLKNCSNIKTKMRSFFFFIIIAISLAGVFNLFLMSSNFSVFSSLYGGVKTLRTANTELEVFQQVIKNSNLEPGVAKGIASVINSESKKYGMDPFLVLSVIQVESNFRTDVVSNRGAIGIMQIMPRTGKYVAEKYNISYRNSRSLYNPVTNIKLGIAYLSYLKNFYDGNVEYALFAYNHGPKKSRYIKRKFKKTKPYYVRKVMNFKQLLKLQGAQVRAGVTGF